MIQVRIFVCNWTWVFWVLLWRLFILSPESFISSKLAGSRDWQYSPWDHWDANDPVGCLNVIGRVIARVDHIVSVEILPLCLLGHRMSHQVSPNGLNVWNVCQDSEEPHCFQVIKMGYHSARIARQAYWPQAPEDQFTSASPPDDWCKSPLWYCPSVSGHGCRSGIGGIVSGKRRWKRK